MKKSFTSYGNYPDLEKVEKILVIKLRHLGDVLLTTPVFQVLKERFPNAEIDAYINREAFPILEENPYLNELIGYDRSLKKRGFFSRIFREVALLWKIRQKGYDLVLNFTEGDRGVLAAFFSKAKVRVGNLPKSKWMKKLLTHIAKQPSSLRHTVEKNLDLLRKIGIFPKPEQKRLYFPLPREKENLLQDRAPFILIHPTSRWKFKCWPVEKMQKLIQELLQRGETIVLTGGSDPEEMEMARKIAEDFPIENLVGKISLKELGLYIQAAKLVICVDSLPLHLASCFQKPNLALFGPTSEITWGPWQNPLAQVITSNLSCRPCYMDGCGGSKKSQCLEEISVERVLLEFEILTKVASTGLFIRDEISDRSR